jgi:hypothetical protein
MFLFGLLTADRSSSCSVFSAKRGRGLDLLTQSLEDLRVVNLRKSVFV